MHENLDKIALVATIFLVKTEDFDIDFVRIMLDTLDNYSTEIEMLKLIVVRVKLGLVIQVYLKVLY